MHFLLKLNGLKIQENVTLRWKKDENPITNIIFLKLKEKITNVSLKINVNYFLFVSANTFDEFFNRNSFFLHFRIFRVIFRIKDLVIFVLQDILNHEIRWLLIAKRFPRLKKNKHGSL